MAVLADKGILIKTHIYNIISLSIYIFIIYIYIMRDGIDIAVLHCVAQVGVG